MPKQTAQQAGMAVVHILQSRHPNEIVVALADLAADLKRAAYPAGFLMLGIGHAIEHDWIVEAHSEAYSLTKRGAELERL